MEKSLILALDIGTSSVRASLFDERTRALRGMSVKIERSLYISADGGAEIEADEAVSQVAAAIDAILDKSNKLKANIEYVASSSFWHSLIGVDAKGKPTTKVFSWADTRSRNYTEILRKRFVESETHNRTGAQFHSSFWPAKLFWIRRDKPEVFAKTDKWLSLSDYVALKLFGQAVTSVSMASGTGIFDIRRCQWDGELLKYLKIKPANLSAISEKDAGTFRLTSKFARRWPRLANSNWFPAIADGAADNIGAGCVTRARAALMVGTSGAMRVAYVGEPPEEIPDGLWCYRIDRRRVIIGGALSDGGGLYQWLAKSLNLPKDVEDQIASRLPAAHGLTFLPFLAGERSTGYHESATGGILGLTSATKAVDIIQAALESVAYRFAQISTRLNTVVKIKEIVASGGALRESPVWTQIIADVLGRDLTINDAVESSSRGAVLLALESIGRIETIEARSELTGRSIIADQGRSAIYRKAMKRHNDSYNSLIL